MGQRHRLVLVLGGTRSGKSVWAERRATEAAEITGPVTYLATGQGDATAMDARIAAHRLRRPTTWTTIECGVHLAEALTTLDDGVVMVDSLGTWIAGHHELRVDIDALVGALVARTGVTVVVSEEVGLAVHPLTEVGRRFVDVVGDVNKAVAAVADDVVLVIAGRALVLPRDGES